MSANIKRLKARIKSVDSTLHLTKAMQLVAAGKIRKATEQLASSRRYCEAMRTVIGALAKSTECASSPYVRGWVGDKAPENGRDVLIVIAGDRGLAGGYNANVFRLMKEYPEAEILPVGKRVCDRVGGDFVSSEAFSYADSLRLAEELCRDFAEGRYARLGVIRTRYVSMMTQEAEVLWILPLGKPEEEKNKTMLFEPDEATVFQHVVPLYVAGVLYAAVRESFASEVAARRMAMDSAGKNAEQMLEDLRLAYNRARQGAITQEITEVVAGSES